MSKSNGSYEPKPEHKFSFGLWTLGNRGRDPFGDAVRRTMPPNEIASVLGEIGAWGVNLHDNDLVPIDATPAERDRIVREFKKACQQAGIVVPMATVSLFFHRVFRDGAFTAADPGPRLACPCSAIPCPATHPSLPTIPKCAPMRCKRPCVRWTWGPSLERKSLCYGAVVKALKRTPAAPPTKPSSACAGPSTICANTTLPGDTNIASPSRPSPTSRAATSTWPPPATTSDSFPPSIILRWSALIPKSLTSRWPDSTSCTASRRPGRPASCSTSI